QAVPAPARARLHLPAGLPRVRLRLAADDARDTSQGCTARCGRGGPQPARTVRAPACGGEGVMAATAVPSPRLEPPRRAKAPAKARARGGVLWIAASGILLAGVVFVNVLVLQLNLSLDSANANRTKLIGENAALQSQYSALLSSPRIQNEAVKRLGLVYED